jgi:hypothetical protein
MSSLPWDKPPKKGNLEALFPGGFKAGDPPLEEETGGCSASPEAVCEEKVEPRESISQCSTEQPDPQTIRAEVPAAMREARRWLLWRSIPQPGKKPRKVPHYANGERRDTTDTPADAAHLEDLETVLAALERGGYAGLGFALGPDENGGCWQGIDLDGITERPEVAALVDLLPGYVERSPSGAGVHAIGYGGQFAALGSNGAGIEGYSGGRFFTVTGDAIGGDLEDLAPFVRGTLAPRHHHTRKGPDATAPVQITPQQVAELRSALNAIQPDGYDTWIRIGHALRELGTVGRELWLTWSQQSAKWNPADARKWESFAGDRTGYQAVFAEAARHGWTNPASNAAQLLALEAGGTPERLRPVPLGDLMKSTIRPPQFAIEPLAPLGEVTVLGAHGGIGKTVLGRTLAAHKAAGQAFAGLAVTRGRAFVLELEDPAEVARFSLRKIIGEFGLDADQVAQNLTIADGTETGGALVVEQVERGARRLIATDLWDQFKQSAAGHELVVIDNASDGYAADENNRQLVRNFMRLLRQFARGNHAAVILLAHIDKTAARYGSAGNSYSGSTAWHNSARSRLDSLTDSVLIF